MSQSRPVRFSAPERARRDLPSRPIYPPITKTTASPETTLDDTVDAAPAPAEADFILAPKRDRITRAVLVTMIGVNFGAVLGFVVWPVLQTLKLVPASVTDVVQRNQGDSISRLDASVQTLNTVVADLHARVTSAGERQEADRQHLAEIDAAFGALRTSVHDMRSTQDAVAAELTANATKARSDIVRLRTSLEELSTQRQPELTAIHARTDRPRQATARPELLDTIRGSIQAPGERRRALGPRESLPQADGHIFDLTPAQ